MTLPRPYSESDDEVVVDGCIRGDLDAFEALLERHGALADVVMLREIGAPAEGEAPDLPAYRRALEVHLRRRDAAALRAWSARESTLRAWLCVIARGVARRRYEADSTRESIVAFFPTPPPPQVQEVEAELGAVRVQELLDRLPPTLGALARLRLRGMDREQIAAAVGLGQSIVVANLERIAARFGELDHASDAASARLATEAYRIVVGAADAAERTRAAVRTEEDAEFRAARRSAEATWRSVGTRVLARSAERTALCLDERSIAGFVDGTMRGAARARSEGHVGACARCVDEVAMLSTDLRAIPVLREAAGLDRGVAIAAALLVSTGFFAAQRLPERVRSVGPRDLRAAREVERLARAAASLESGRVVESPDSSRLVPRGFPSDDEAPLVAFEALVRGDAHGASRAIDDHTARHPLAARLRLLAAAAGDDPLGARALAADIASRPRFAPGALEDAASVLALPEGRALPREIVVERLRDVLPEIVRGAIARAARG